jgi:NADPH:quinone reductase-like Zn-dependent oxidoreductase
MAWALPCEPESVTFTEAAALGLVETAPALALDACATQAGQTVLVASATQVV